jgi:hypothetical protein
MLRLQTPRPTDAARRLAEVEAAEDDLSLRERALARRANALKERERAIEDAERRLRAEGSRNARELDNVRATRDLLLGGRDQQVADLMTNADHLVRIDYRSEAYNPQAVSAAVIRAGRARRGEPLDVPSPGAVVLPPLPENATARAVILSGMVRRNELAADDPRYVAALAAARRAR